MSQLARWSCTIAAFCVSSVALATSPLKAGESRWFIQDNDLGQYDKADAPSNMDKATFMAIIEAAKKVYDPIAKQNNEKLTINARWDDGTVNANCRRGWGNVTINMYGGLARRPEVTPDGFALVLCHELGHAYGGAPYIQEWTKMSAEGQADYYGAKDCMKAIVDLIAYDSRFDAATPYMEEKCAAAFTADTNEYKSCIRRLQAGQSLGSLMSTIMEEATPDYETPDPTEVPSTLTSYPDTVQCRLDTYHNGVLGLVRPRCWFKN